MCEVELQPRCDALLSSWCEVDLANDLGTAKNAAHDEPHRARE
jgi:hypothetical protein